MPRSRKRRSTPGRPRRSGDRSGLALRVAAAVVILLGGIAVVAYLALRPAPAPRAPEPDPGVLVRNVARRHGCAPERITVEPPAPDSGGLWEITVHAPRGFSVERFVLDLEAEAHNRGGRLDARPLAEKGGYGLTALEGELGGGRCRIVVVRDEPPPRRTPPPRVTGTTARLAIVLDDGGYSMEPVAAISELPRAVAVAVLPNAPFAGEMARALHAEGREVLLHLPMEPGPGHGPGPGPDAIMVGQSSARVAELVRHALTVVAGARGVNNHMGSRATADPATMRAVMEALRGSGLYFLDSRTTPDTVAERTARELGVPALHRDVFLDVVSDPAAIRRALAKAVSRARADGAAVAIGHVHPLTLEVLRSELEAGLDGVQLVPPSRLLTPR